MITLTYSMDTGAQIQIEFEDSISRFEISREFDKSLWYHNISIDEKDTRRIEVGDCGLIPESPNQLATKRLIANIDLSPLSACTDLQKLSFNDLGIYNIDLSPLNSCDKLQNLSLYMNNIHSIDLSTINACNSIEALNLGWNSLSKIDLSPLSTWTNLQRLDLFSNKINTIDLSPLSTCTSLQKIRLGGNTIRSVQLDSLSSCINLRHLDLSFNEIRSIDLSPLATCAKLQVLDLFHNWIQRINIYPLRFFDALSRLNLRENQIKDLNITPLFENPRATVVNSFRDLDGYEGKTISWLQPRTVRGIHETIYAPPLELVPWSFLYEVAMQFKSNYRVQHDICLALGLIDYGFIDFDLTEILLSIAPETSYEEYRKILVGNIVEVISETVNNKGSTIGLNLQKLLLEHKEIAAHANRIIELRKREINRIRIPVNNIDEVDLRGLWTTAYGFEILTALNMKLTTNLDGLDQIKSAFSEIGVALKTCKASTSAAKMSRRLKETIWWIVENTGRLWAEIIPPVFVDKKPKSSSLETEILDFLTDQHGTWVSSKIIPSELGYENRQGESRVNAALIQLFLDGKAEMYMDRNGEYYKKVEPDDVEAEPDETVKTIKDFMQPEVDEATRKTKDFKQTRLEDFYDQE